MKVFVFINTELKKEKEVLQRLRGTQNVGEAFMLYGTYDIVAVIEADSMENLNHIYKMITRIEGVQSATTMIAIEGTN
ncbi:Lrp/AsnC ligand binding domain-containing protein [Candidatus Bathyarchaeota archaeon]|nr:Lrp/AsnC ligand binding domain-containing protein [Candidatus Bathyarchaeota archaeon]